MVFCCPLFLLINPLYISWYPAAATSSRSLYCQQQVKKVLFAFINQYLMLSSCLPSCIVPERKEKSALYLGFVWEHSLHHYFRALNDILAKQRQYSQIVCLKQSGLIRERQNVSDCEEILFYTSIKMFFFLYFCSFKQKSFNYLSL